MRALIQRVTRATVYVDHEAVGSIDHGLVIFVGVGVDDDQNDARQLAGKTAELRIFEDAAGKFNLSARDVKAQLLVVSQFTLYADTSRGRRPDLTGAARPSQAEPLVEEFSRSLEALGLRVERGRFQAKMLVELWNDGPVTIWLDSRRRSA